MPVTPPPPTPAGQAGKEGKDSTTVDRAERPTGAPPKPGWVACPPAQGAQWRELPSKGSST